MNEERRLPNIFSKIVFILLSIATMSVYAGNFFPPEYKVFPFAEGDLLASQRTDGTFSVSKILKIDRIEIRKGGAIQIQGKRFVATEDDFLLIVSSAYGKNEFRTLEEAKAAAVTGKWHIAYGHVPNRTPGAAQGQILIGHAPVQESELVGYRQWKAAFDSGDAGVF